MYNDNNEANLRGSFNSQENNIPEQADEPVLDQTGRDQAAEEEPIFLQNKEMHMDRLNSIAERTEASLEEDGQDNS